MNFEKLEKNVASLVEELDQESFIFDLLIAYGQPKSTIARIKKGDYNQAKKAGEVLRKKLVYFKHEPVQDLHAVIDEARTDPKISKQHPRFLVVTDFEDLLAVDTKTDDTLDIPIADLAKHADFFGPWAGFEKQQIKNEAHADIKAAERMGKLYDLILHDNPPKTDADRHALNIFLSRLLFCYFAEDTGIFKEDQFTNSLASHTVDDGKDLQAYLQRLFTVLNTDAPSQFPKYLQEFPYVNGGLFGDESPVPQFTAKSRDIVIECGSLNWRLINPDIFGSMIQAVVHHSMRGSMGIHYTSVVNIMKVIEPLFLNDLKEELEKAGTSKAKLNKLLERLYRIRVFDPACGSGNFLIIAFKELCKLEIEIFKRLQAKQGGQKQLRFESNIQLTQFYGIEIDDFAHETAKLSLWLAEHQMNLAFKEVFSDARPTLPLQDGGKIDCGNATRMEWKDFCQCDSTVEAYLFGNPPYLGARTQTTSQKSDVRYVLGHVKGVNSLDYITCWFIKAADFIRNSRHQCAFVTTNSLCQGEQVSLFWPHLLDGEIEISFAHQAFRWSNSAKANAGVTCNVVGLRSVSEKEKYIYSDVHARIAGNISPYLTDNKTLYVYKRKRPLSDIPVMAYGNQPIEGGYLKLNRQELKSIADEYPDAKRFFRKLTGATEFLNGQERFCIWIEDSELENALAIEPFRTRIDKVRAFRETGGQVAKSLVDRSHQFRYRHEAKTSFLLMPIHSSENRDYIPVGMFDREYLTLHSAQIIYDAPTWAFAIVSSRMHMVWLRALSGGLETRIRYSSALCYNTFPFPRISKDQKSLLEQQVFKVLDKREVHSEKTIAQLYGDRMPTELRQAHSDLDDIIEQCYRKKKFVSDEERLEFLFLLYEEMLELEKTDA